MRGRVKETERGKVALLRRLADPGSGLVEVAGGWQIVMPDGGKRSAAQATAGMVAALRTAGFLLCDPDGRWTLSPAGRRRLAVAAGRSDPFRRQHQHVVTRRLADPAGATVRVAADAAESPLAWLYTRKDRDGRSLITEAQYRAGLRLHADFIRSSLAPRLTTNWDASLAEAPGVNGGNLTPSEQALAARQRYRRALAGVGPELSRILVEVCCLGTGIETAERVLGLPRRSGKVVLQLALSSLARCYGLLGDEVRSGAGALRSWGRAGFRPRVAPASGPS
ncbi:MAG TPA: DUF6456 domain-containing protein [Aestuariivirgaceae bacterium]|nr:DUF6456 domain-containing protein [Aestuariivirgaceae bacterium]